MRIIVISLPGATDRRRSASMMIGERRSLKSRKLALLLARAAYKGFGVLQRIGFDRSQRHRMTGTGR